MATPKGLKSTSSPLQISASVTELVANTFAFDEIPLTLNVLDNEVFVVTQINIDVDAPDGVVGLTTGMNASLSSTQRTSPGTIADSNVIGAANRTIVGQGALTGIPFDREDPLFASMSEDYLGIIATNNMFLNIAGFNNGNVKSARCRVYGYRASATAAVYAALVQSELLSA
jgi:hypothetical protein